jgi:hypothetical protein
MQTYYSFTNFFNNVCAAHPSIETFSMDDIREIDTFKQTLFPLANLIVNNVAIDSGVMTYNVTFMVMDRVADIIPDSVGRLNTKTYDYKTITNIIDVHNSTLLTLNDVVSYIYRNPDAYQFSVIGSSLATPFEERFSNLLAGWAIDMNISVGNPQDMCVINLSPNLAEGGVVSC